MSNQETERQYTERLLNEMIAEANAAEQARAEEARVAKANAAGAIAARTAAVLARAVKPALPRSEPVLGRTALSSTHVAPGVDAPEMMQASRELLIEDLFPVAEWPQPPKAQFPKLRKKADRRSDVVIAALGITLGLICALFPWYIFFNQDQFGVQAIKFGGTGTNSGRVGGGVVAARSAPLTAKDVPNAGVDLLATGAVQDDAKTEPPGDQPFPADIAKFRMVHVANGRAMIEDDTGLWMVQRGSTLPDSSKVSAIEQRNGKWVMLTSANQVIELSR
ncbi:MULTISPECIES: hypothetical protein [unclassified Mesorhizobium]|uniref:hypothetical protein n=1 Tax=unclassified Mesorhizobium TaxID=325217 RepID=UPI000FCBFD6A|nr:MULTISPECIES: hypothetical protein [unclassified Mesorhizobium]RUW98248.1 hypothetical protein EOA30_26260 [Mesorhizobium sp. M8A.F.Ca.ET.059.01.1.1]TGR48786.1 hypothetical protein EN842_21065 [bacterium M00.F.Ca.ET.199.01.1.1]TGU37827.1 hypothetical protein EN799_11845 [bacterium M00.F.Ca.ET.156.01.1.1]TGU96787.1 hypothetical protein EN794_013715 [Mesorhizobium sp. M00.F.Ca.ET.151.01.1.1]TGV14506.1 hypothetical protein EN816_10160 [Mesorhizobium sp. M8A.F.Ca.ET.173.01.1.1]TGV88756.1 hypot